MNSALSLQAASTDDGDDDPPRSPGLPPPELREGLIEPHPVLEPLRLVLGLLIAAATLTVPLGAVLLDRASSSLTITLPSNLPRPLSHGSDATVGFTSPRGGESGGGDSGRQP